MNISKKAQKLIALKANPNSETPVIKTITNEYEIHGGTPEEHEAIKKLILQTQKELHSKNKSFQSSSIEEIENTIEKISKIK